MGFCPGVKRRKGDSKKWSAMIKHQGVPRRLGCFDDPRAAALAYDRWGGGRPHSWLCCMFTALITLAHQLWEAGWPRSLTEEKDGSCLPACLSACPSHLCLPACLPHSPLPACLCATLTSACLCHSHLCLPACPSQRGQAVPLQPRAQLPSRRAAQPRPFQALLSLWQRVSQWPAVTCLAVSPPVCLGG